MSGLEELKKSSYKVKVKRGRTQIELAFDISLLEEGDLSRLAIELIELEEKYKAKEQRPFQRLA